jgi:hypothetical protein
MLRLKALSVYLTKIWIGLIVIITTRTGVKLMV